MAGVVGPEGSSPRGEFLPWLGLETTLIMLTIAPRVDVLVPQDQDIKFEVEQVKLARRLEESG